MTDDIKLTAAFMGIKLQETCLCKHSEFTRRIGYKCPICHKIILVPDYPKDMNALLGVAKKIHAEVTLDYAINHVRLRDENYNATSGYFNIYTAEKSLFLLLVEAIKQIKESE